MDYYEEFVYYSRLTCCREHEYLDKKRVRENNRAMDKLNKIRMKMYGEEDHCKELALRLLNHEDVKVQLSAGAYCLMACVHKEEAVRVLQQIKRSSSDGMTRVRASDNLLYCKPYEELQ